MLLQRPPSRQCAIYVSQSGERGQWCYWKPRTDLFAICITTTRNSIGDRRHPSPPKQPRRRVSAGSDWQYWWNNACICKRNVLFPIAAICWLESVLIFKGTECRSHDSQGLAAKPCMIDCVF